MSNITIEVCSIEDEGKKIPKFISFDLNGIRHVVTDFRKSEQYKDDTVINLVTSHNSVKEDIIRFFESAKKSGYHDIEKIEAELIKHEKGYLSYTHIKSEKFKSFFNHK